MTETMIAHVIEEELLFINEETGEVVESSNLPPEQMDTVHLLDWLGPVVADLQAQIEGLEAEKRYWLDRIERQYAPEINRLRRTITYLTEIKYGEKIRDYAQRNLVGKKARSFKHGLITLGFRKTGGKLVVLDESKAIHYLKLADAEEALQQKVTVLKSKIPVEVRAALEHVSSEVSGMSLEPESDEFYIK